MRRTLMVGALALALAAGCGGEKKNDGAAPEGDPAQVEAAPSFDAAALKAKLQGTWISGDEKKPQFKFVFDGDKASVTDMRFMGEPKTETGKLKINSAYELGVELPDGTTYKYDMVEVDGTMHLGLGKVFEVESLDSFTLKTAMFESIVKQGDSCKWIKSFGDKAEERAITCKTGERDGKKTLGYQEPDSFDKEKLADRELFVFGKLLVDEELLSAVAKKQ
ncbi:MAG: hypothetical protein EP329_17430 [Deltaproteobacteria bacterium]|nr:MAG: hypothetical protein EP329_17430 [Deltaproteobacteria bacterium]